MELTLTRTQKTGDFTAGVLEVPLNPPKGEKTGSYDQQTEQRRIVPPPIGGTERGFIHTLEPGCIDHVLPPANSELKTENSTLSSVLPPYGGIERGAKGPIPPGRYRITFRWSNHFQREMPYLENVPGFTGIMIHPGNTTQDTRGCILVGQRHDPADNGRLVNSRSTFHSFTEHLRSASDEIYLTVKG